MGSKLYVGGLPYSATEQQLSELFGAHGTVASARIIADKFTGQSRGFGFVEMSSDSEAKAAITVARKSRIPAIRIPPLPGNMAQCLTVLAPELGTGIPQKLPDCARASPLTSIASHL